MTTSHAKEYSAPMNRQDIHATRPGSDQKGPSMARYLPMLASPMDTSDMVYFPAFITCSIRSLLPRWLS